MTKHRNRHARAYAAGAKAMAEEVKSVIGAIIPEKGDQIGRVIDNIRKGSFPMPPAFHSTDRRAGKTE